MDPHPTASQEVVYDRGTPVVVSRGKTLDVLVAPEGGPTGRHRANHRVTFMLAIRNRSAASVEVVPSEFLVTADESPAELIDAESLEDDVLAAAAASHSWAAFTGVAEAQLASAAGWTSHNFATGSAVASGTSYSAGAALDASWRAEDRAMARERAIDEKTAERLREVAHVLQHHTLRPAQAVTGLVVISPGRARSCKGEVAVEEEEGVVVAPPDEDDAGGSNRMTGRGSAPSNQARLCDFSLVLIVGGERHQFRFKESK